MIHVRMIHVWQAVENLVYQRASGRENDFASSIKIGQEPNGIKLSPKQS
jgi:hypothetical protein